jgi:hypothetical protein
MHACSTASRRTLTAAVLVMAAACTDRAPLADARAPLAGHALDFAVSRVVGAEGFGLSITDVAIADLDGDGHLDLATGSRSGWVAAFLNKGGGELGPGKRFGASESPRKIALADVDGDGRPDIVGLYWAGAVVMRNDGQGGFQQTGNLFFGGAAHALAAGDFEGDGKADVALGADDGVHLFAGKGDGAFSADRLFPVGVHADQLLSADIDGDGRRDLVVVSQPGEGVLIFNRAAGLVAGPAFRVLSKGSTAQGIAAVDDLDGDGRPDVAFAFHDATTQGVVTLLGEGDGSFRDAFDTQLEAGQDPSTITAADLDGDGELDLAIGITNGSAVHALLGNGDGSFRRGGYAGVSAPPIAVAAGDLDGDGKPDVVTVGGEVLTVLPGNGDGTFRGERLLLIPMGARRIVAGDFDGDGNVDCVLAWDDAHASYTTMRGDGRGGLRAIASGSLGEDATGEIAAVDLNADGKLDLVSAHRATVLLGEGNGRFGLPRSFGGARGTAADRLALGDVDGDGKLDLVLVETRAAALRLLAGRGDGTFGPERPIDAGAPVRHAALADLDGDGKLDLAVGTNMDLRLLYGHGDGTFDPPQILDLGAPVANVAAADLDGDGKLDLVLAHERRDESTVLRNEGRRAFRPTARVGATGALAIRDVDGDGIPDLVARNGPVAFLSGNGDGTFAAPQRFGAGDDLVLADLDHDGRLDLVLVQTANPFLRLIRNTSR